MTEKRFKLDSEVGFIDTQKCGGDTMTLFEVVVELNKLNDENNQLKEDLEEYCNFSLHDVLDKKNKEIGQLKFQNQQLDIDIMNNQLAYCDLKKENKQLKQQISYYEKLITDKEVEWLRNNTVWEQMPSNKRTVTKTSK